MKKIATAMLALVVVGSLAYLGWRWVHGVTVEEVIVRGVERADSSAVAALAGIEIGGPMLDVSPEIASDRVRRHPWVERASVSRQPTGSVIVSVREREPVALALDRNGRPAYYLDAKGFRMPVSGRPAGDLPIFRGIREAYHPVQPLENEALLGLLALLPEMEDLQDALLSEVHDTAAGIEIHTAVTPAGQSVRVRLGRTDLARKLDLLEAYWLQQVLTRPTIQYDWLDLRFRDQVVARERA